MFFFRHRQPFNHTAEDAELNQRSYSFAVTGGSINVRPLKPNHGFSYKRAAVSFNFGKKEAFYFHLKWFNLLSFSLLQAVFFFYPRREKIRHDSLTRACLKKQIFLILHSLSSSYQTAGAEKSPEERSAVPALIKTPETGAGGEEKQIVHRLREQGG